MMSQSESVAVLNRSTNERTRRAERAIQLADTSLATVAFIALFAEDAVRAVVGNGPAVAIAAFICLMYSLRLARNWRKIRWMRMPLMLLMFLVSSGLALLWSSDLESSLIAWSVQLATAGAAIGMTMLLPWPALVKALGTSVRWVLGLGLVLELVSVLLVHGPILGLTGHMTMLSFAAVILLLVLPLQLAERTAWRGWAYMWLLFALAALAYTQSVPAWAAVVVCAARACLVLWSRVSNPLRRLPVYLVIGILAAGGIFAAFAAWPQVTQASADGSWSILVSTSSPLAVVFFVMLLITTTWRAWFVAVDRPQWDLDARRPFTATSMLPMLLVVALVTMGTFDARLTLESGLLLIAICAVITKYPERLRGELR